MTIQEDRALYWLSQGAQPSDAARRILEKLGVMATFEGQKSVAPEEVVEVEAQEA
jgi:ribosomal protein S16